MRQRTRGRWGAGGGGGGEKEREGGEWEGGREVQDGTFTKYGHIAGSQGSGGHYIVRERTSHSRNHTTADGTSCS